jgi:hypothetical protein
MMTKHKDRFTIGFTYHAECYCYECGDKLPTVDPEGNDKNPIASWHEFIWTDNEGNCQPFQCGECGKDIK